MNTLSRWLTLAVLCFCPTVSASDSVLAEYAQCWEAGDLPCMEKLFTPRAYRKVKPNLTKVFAKTVHREMVFGVTHESQRRWFKRKVIVAAYTGRSDTATEDRNLSGVLGLELNRKGRIKRLHEVHTLSPDGYAAKWPTVQAQAAQHRKATLGDSLSTACALARLGTGAEANPIARVVFGLGPIPGAFVWFSGADSLLQKSLENDYWDGLGPLPSGQQKGLLAFRWIVVANNTYACLG